MDNLTHDEHLRAEGALNALEIAGVRIKELEAQLAALQWTEIDADHLPKEGDELISKRGHVMEMPPLNYLGSPLTLEELLSAKWIYYRPINPPQKEGDAE
jgi:hypothetical protein